MTTQVLEIEGTWEEIIAQSAKFADRRVRVIVLAEEPLKSAFSADSDARCGRFFESRSSRKFADVRGISIANFAITSMEDGFDFLGFNSRHYDGKLLIKPSKKKVLAFCKRIGEEVKSLNGAEQEVLIKKLNPILRGFANYYNRPIIQVRCNRT